MYTIKNNKIIIINIIFIYFNQKEYHEWQLTQIVGLQIYRVMQKILKII